MIQLICEICITNDYEWKRNNKTIPTLIENYCGDQSERGEREREERNETKDLFAGRMPLSLSLDSDGGGDYQLCIRRQS